MTKTEANREWRRANKDKCAANAKRCREKHIERYRERERLWRANNKDKRAAAARRRRAENPEKEKATIEKNRFHYPLYKARSFAKKWGHQPCSASPQELKEAFTGFCFVCEQPEGEIKLHMDHDHVTGKFRGWLCKACNHALGFVNDSTERLEKLLIYLREFNA